MNYYQKIQKPIPAIQFREDEKNARDLVMWGRDKQTLITSTVKHKKLYLLIGGDRGTMIVTPGDYLVFENGAFRVVKPGVFKKIYQQIDE